MLRLHVLYTDHFGNLITDLTPQRWAAWLEEVGGEEEGDLAAQCMVRAGKQRWRGIARTFADVAVGSPLAYWGSSGTLEIGIRNGHAARTLSLSPGDTIMLILP